jgi:hypothetical protein
LNGFFMVDRDDSPASGRQRTAATRYFCLALSGVVAFLLLIFDYAPPLPPFPAAFETADCHYVRLTDFVYDLGFFELSVSHGGSLEYPPEYLPNFVSVELSTGQVAFNYTGEHAVGFSRTGSAMRLRYAHPFSGPSSATVRCASRVLGRAAGDLPDAPAADQNASYQSLAAQFHRVCLEDDRLVFFAPLARVHAGVPLGPDATVPVVFVSTTMKAYVDRHEVRWQPSPAVLIPALPAAPLELALFALPDLFGLVGAHPSVQHYNFLSLGDAGAATRSVLAMIGASPPVNRSAVACFRQLFVLNVRAGYGPHELRMALARNFSDVRKWFRKAASANRKHIFVAPGLRHRLEDRILEFCNDCEVRVIDLQRFEGWPSNFSDTGVLIATQLEHLVPLLFMNEGATVIDATPEKCLCEVGREFAERHGVRYITIRTTALCNCSTDFVGIDDDDIQKIITLLKDGMNS